MKAWVQPVVVRHVRTDQVAVVLRVREEPQSHMPAEELVVRVKGADELAYWYMGDVVQVAPA